MGVVSDYFQQYICRRSPADTRPWPNVGLMLGECLQRSPNIKPTLGQPLVSAGRQTLYTFMRERDEIELESQDSALNAG